MDAKGPEDGLRHHRAAVHLRRDAPELQARTRCLGPMCVCMSAGCEYVFIGRFLRRLFCKRRTSSTATCGVTCLLYAHSMSTCSDEVHLNLVVSCALSQAWLQKNARRRRSRQAKNERQGKLWTKQKERVKVEALRKTHGEIGLPKSMKPKPKSRRLQFKRRCRAFMCGFSLRRYCGVQRIQDRAMTCWHELQPVIDYYPSIWLWGGSTHGLCKSCGLDRGSC